MATPEFRIEHDFALTRDQVWRAWTDPALLAEWYGPGVETLIPEFDLKPGGRWLTEMKWGDQSHRQIVEFKEVAAPERLVWHHHSADADWSVAANSMMPDWPRTLLSELTLTERDGQTSLVLVQTPVDASPDELACFENMSAGMGQGWTKGFAILADLFD